MFLYQCLKQIIAFLIKIKNSNWIVEWTRLENTRALDLGGGDFGIPIFFSSGHRTHYEGLFRSSMVYFQIRFSCQLSQKHALDWGWWLRFFALKLIDINAYWYCTSKKIIDCEMFVCFDTLWSIFTNQCVFVLACFF